MPNMGTLASYSVAAVVLLATVGCAPVRAPLGNIVELQRATALEELKRTPGVVLVDFYADW